MTHVDVVGYRDWAEQAFFAVLTRRQVRNDSIRSLHYRTDTAIVCPDAEVVFLVGWSALVPPEFYRDRMVLVVHPSALPAYAGGSPIQHQIIDGLTESAVSIFRLDDAHPEVDSGPLAFQRGYSLEGPLAHVLTRIADVTAVGIEAILAQYPDVCFWEQPPHETPSRRRRTPADSEITQLDLAAHSARDLYNKVRALQAPYPNAYIVCADGQRLYITDARLDEVEDSNEKAGDRAARR